jgi:hypothetical protein
LIVIAQLEPLHPAVLAAISQVFNVANDAGKTVCICGEMASDPMATLVLVGMGLTQLSLSPLFIPVISTDFYSKKISDQTYREASGIRLFFFFAIFTSSHHMLRRLNLGISSPIPLRISKSSKSIPQSSHKSTSQRMSRRTRIVIFVGAVGRAGFPDCSILSRDADVAQPVEVVDNLVQARIGVWRLVQSCNDGFDKLAGQPYDALIFGLNTGCSL